MQRYIHALLCIDEQHSAGPTRSFGEVVAVFASSLSVGANIETENHLRFNVAPKMQSCVTLGVSIRYHMYTKPI